MLINTKTNGAYLFMINKIFEFIGNIVINIGKSILPIIEFIGQCILNLLLSIKYLLLGKINFKNTLQQAAVIGFDSIGILKIEKRYSSNVLHWYCLRSIL